MASAVGVAVVLLVWGIAVSTLGTATQFRYNPGATTLLMSGTIGMVALPVIVLIATIARLSAEVEALDREIVAASGKAGGQSGAAMQGLLTKRARAADSLAVAEETWLAAGATLEAIEAA